ncbi:histidine phosphatase family protein [Nanoarchaeota archaeon]
MRLIITRHGETVENKNKIMQGHIPGVLSELGIEQAKKVAERLKDQNFDCIFSSDLARAADTAKEIAKFHPDTNLDLTEDLRERYLGNLQGKKASQEFKGKKWDPKREKKYNVETSEQLFDRAKKLIGKISEEHHGKKVLLVGHQGINTALITYLLGKPQDNMGELGSLKNTSITIFEFNEDKNPILKLMNCVKHLDE